MKIFNDVTHDELIKLLPKEYADRLPKDPPGRKYLVLLFATDRNDVNLSGKVRRGLKKVNLRPNQILLAVGSVFTLEALEALSEAGAKILNISEFPWTDEDYLSVRQGRIPTGR